MRLCIGDEWVLVDDEEAWRFAPQARHKYYVLNIKGVRHVVRDTPKNSEGGRARIYYHSEVHNKPEGNVIYHKDLDTLNCMKSNLADCTRKDLAKILARIRKGEQV